MTETVTITVELPVDEAEGVLEYVGAPQHVLDPVLRARVRFYDAVVEQYKPTPEPAVGQVWEFYLGEPRLVVAVRNGQVTTLAITGPSAGMSQGSWTLEGFKTRYKFLAATEAEWEATR